MCAFLFSFFLSFSLYCIACESMKKKTEHSVERFLKSESATTSCSLVERIARTSGPAICRASNSNDYICSRFKGTGQTLIEFERRPTKRSIRVLSLAESFVPLFDDVTVVSFSYAVVSVKIENEVITHVRVTSIECKRACWCWCWCVH